MMYELYVGRRYTRAGRRDNFVSTISIISMVGIALSVAALIVVLSVVNGFQREFRDRILTATAPVQVSGYEGWLDDWRPAAKAAAALPAVLASAPYLDVQAMLSTGSLARGVLLRGIDPAAGARVIDFARLVESGSLDALASGSRAVLLGADLAEALGAHPGDALTLIVPQADPAAPPRLAEVRVAGLLRVGLYEFDSTLALVNLQDLAEVAGTGERVSGLSLRLADPFAAPAVARALARELPDLAVSDWTRSHLNLFQAVQTSRTMLTIVLALIVAVAAFNIVATLVMAVLDKEADIAILRTLGATPGAILRIFMVQGSLIGTLGTSAGVLLGVLGALNARAAVHGVESLLGFHFLSPQVYHIAELPSDLQAGDVLFTALSALALSFLATLYPSWRAARVRPAEVLRYE